MAFFLKDDKNIPLRINIGVGMFCPYQTKKGKGIFVLLKKKK